MSSTPTAVRFATYPTDVTSIVGRQIMGPNTMGEYMTPVSAVYDPATNRTRVGFAYGALAVPVLDEAVSE